jgi:hypothetical protein
VEVISNFDMIAVWQNYFFPTLGLRFHAIAGSDC